MRDRRGKFFVLEGPDGGGKTTQAQLLARYLGEKNIPVAVTREPGGTQIGECVRRLLLDPLHSKMSRRTELMLYMAARAQLCEEFLEPTLAKGISVISERFLLSSVVYQGYAGGLGVEETQRIGALITGGLEPDLTIVLDVEPEEGIRRREALRPDRIEQKDLDYHRRVREGFLLMAKKNPRKIKVLSGNQSVEALHAEIRRLVQGVLGTK